MKLGERIRHERSQQKKTLVDVASKVGIAVSTLCDIEKNRHEPSLKTLRRISEALNKPPSFFMENGYGGSVISDPSNTGTEG